MRVRPAQVVAFALLLVGALVVSRAITGSMRSSPPAPGGAGPALPTESESARHPHLRSSAEISYDATPTEATVADIARGSAQRLRESASAALAAGEILAPERLGLLADVFESHLAVVLRSDYDAWRAFVSSLGIEFAAGAEGGPPTREEFERAARVYRYAPVAVRDVTVRPLFIKGREIEHPTFYGGRAFGRPGAPYGAPRDPVAAGATVYEVLIPMRRHVGRETLPFIEANTGFAYLWSAERRSWLPFSLTAYTDGTMVASVYYY